VGRLFRSFSFDPFIPRRTTSHTTDIICYNYCSLEPYQALITVNASSNYGGIYYTRVTDPLIASFLNLRRRLGHLPPLPPILKSPSVRSICNHLPLTPSLYTPEYIPTRMLVSLLCTLCTHFPRRRLLLGLQLAARRDTRHERARSCGRGCAGRRWRVQRCSSVLACSISSVAD
jgi:hypothetical protein